MRKNVLSPFIQLIWEIVSDPQTDPIISWNPNGTSFYILNPSQFADDVLKKHFKHTNISSFVRQLNMYNFHKNKANANTQEFHHKLFRRDARQLLMGIKRKPSQEDYREGEELLRHFLGRKGSDEKLEQMEDESKEEVNELTANEVPLQLSALIKSRLSRNEEPLDMNNLPVPQEILNIIIVPIHH